MDHERHFFIADVPVGYVVAFVVAICAATIVMLAPQLRLERRLGTEARAAQAPRTRVRDPSALRHWAEPQKHCAGPKKRTKSQEQHRDLPPARSDEQRR